LNVDQALAVAAHAQAAFEDVLMQGMDVDAAYAAAENAAAEFAEGLALGADEMEESVASHEPAQEELPGFDPAAAPEGLENYYAMLQNATHEQALRMEEALDEFLEKGMDLDEAAQAVVDALG
jgi:hypothetical protein